MDYVAIEHGSKVLNKLNLDRLQENKHCDATLLCDDQEFPVHKNVLSMLSTFFDKLFTTEMNDKYQRNFKIEGVSADDLKEILTFLYSGVYAITEENAFDVYAVANYLAIEDLEEQCSRFVIQNLNFCNCLSSWIRSTKVQNEKLESEIEKYLRSNFAIVKQNDVMSDMDFKTFQSFIQLKSDSCESEEVALTFIQKWVNADESRRQYFPELFSLINIEKLRKLYLLNNLTKADRLSTIKAYGLNYHRVMCGIVGKENCLELSGFAKLMINQLVTIVKKTNAEIGLNQYIFVMNDTSTDLRLFNLLTKEEMAKTRRNEERSEAGLITHGDYFYVIGGIVGEERTDSCVKLNFKRRRCGWESAGPTVCKRRKLVATNCEGEIWAVGDKIIKRLQQNNSDSSFGSTSFGFGSSSTHQLRTKPCLAAGSPSSLIKPAQDVIVIDGNLLALNYDLLTCEAFDPANNSTEDIYSLPVGCVKAIAVNDQMYILTRENNTLAMQEYDLSSSTGNVVGNGLTNVARLQDACVAHGKIVIAIIGDDDLLRLYDHDLTSSEWRFIKESANKASYSRLVPIS